MTEKLEVSKNKLIVLSQLLKEMKNLYREDEGKDLLVYKLKTQRRMVETLFDVDAVDLYINKLRTAIHKKKLKQQITDFEDDEVDAE
jgi:hypothetical protein